MKIIDIHCHLSNKFLHGLHTKTATIEDINALMRTYHISGTVLLATCFPYKGTGINAQELLDIIDKDPDSYNGVLPKYVFGTLDASKLFLYKQIKELTKLLEQKLIKGIKLYPGYQRFSIADIKLHHIYELAEYYDVPVMIHAGGLHSCCIDKTKCTPCNIEKDAGLANPVFMKEIFNRYYTVNFIISHLASPYFKKLQLIMEEYPNVYTDTSGQWVSGKEDTHAYRVIINQQILNFCKVKDAKHRILFGTDFPIQSHQDSIYILKNVPQDMKEDIFYLNACKLLKIKE